jgi:hypothetical protein
MRNDTRTRTTSLHDRRNDGIELRRRGARFIYRRINLRRGLFRLWIVFACAFIVAVAVASSGGISGAFEKASPRKDLFGLPLVPVDCADARGYLLADYSKEKQDMLCWYTIPKYRAFYYERKDVDDDQLADRLYEKAGIPLASSFEAWVKLVNAAGVALGVPLAVLVLGLSLMWAFSGFLPARSN